jgi:hypothetical protein
MLPPMKIFSFITAKASSNIASTFRASSLASQLLQWFALVAADL